MLESGLLIGGPCVAASDSMNRALIGSSPRPAFPAGASVYDTPREEARMPMFKRRGSRNSQPTAQAVELEPLSSSLPDADWWAASAQRFEQTKDAHYGSPETFAAAGQDRYGNQDFGTAVFFFEKAIDLMHTLYTFDHFQRRQPSPARRRTAPPG